MYLHGMHGPVDVRVQDEDAHLETVCSSEKCRGVADAVHM